MPDETILSPSQARAQLAEGNRRFATGNARHPHQSARRRAEVVDEQHPFAVILSCADSREPPEIIFDQGIGDLFVIRNAGAIVDDVVLGSIEFAVQKLGPRLVLVVGHTTCGAVTAALQGEAAPGHLGSITAAIRPAVEASRAATGDPLLNAVKENVRRTVEQIRRSEPVLAAAVRTGRLEVSGALYHLDRGEVEFF